MASTVLAIVFSVFFLGCEKEYDIFEPEQHLLEPPLSTISLRYSVSTPNTKSTTSETTNKGSLVSGQTISGDSSYYFSFWLEPAEGNNIADGIYQITNNATGAIVYGPSAQAENGIDFLFPSSGDYTLRVQGNYEGVAFDYNDITVIVTQSGGDDDNPTIPPTSPVRLYNFAINEGSASVHVAINKNEYASQTSSNWFHIYRINGTSFVTNQAVTNEVDSVRFVLNFSATNNTFVEFNTAFHDGSPGGMWLTPSAGENPSILYSGSTNIPYNNSGSFFGFRLHITSTSQAELRTYNGVTVATAGATSNVDIPGENGDGPASGYVVRWSGYKHFIKTALSNPTFRYKIGAEGTWTFLTLTQNANPDYRELTFPNGTTGELHFQWGSGETSATFVPATTEMSASMYWQTTLSTLVKNI